MLNHGLQRGIALALTVMLAIPPLPVVAASKEKPAPTPVINTTAPTVAPPPRELRFSLFPSEDEIFRAGTLALPLLKVEGPGLGRWAEWRENRALAQALQAYAEKRNGDDLAPLVSFLERYPQSGWRASLLGNLGLVWRRSGRFQRGIDSFEEAWELTRTATGGNARAIGDWAAGELAHMHSHLGHRERVESLLEEVRGRKVMGPATEQLMTAKEALYRSREHPEGEYRCGLMAVASLLRLQGKETPAEVLSAKASPQGMSLAGLQRLSRSAGLALHAIQRRTGSPVPVPSIVHWKVDHYSAILESRIEEGREQYLVENPLFEDRIWVSREALDEETSGYMLMVTPDLQAGWRPAPEGETSRVYGRCWRGDLDEEQTRCLAVTVGGDGPPCQRQPCQAPRSMPEYRFHAMLVSLNIADQPVGYSPPVGPAVRFNMYYNQREAGQPPANMFTFSNLGPKWTFDWMAWVEDDGER